MGEAAVALQVESIESPFVKEMIKQWRAQDTHGAWDGKTDLQLLDPYILDKERRKQIPLMGDPDPETI
jgi:probable nitrogen fixation protein